MFGALTPCFFAISFLIMKHVALRHGFSSIPLSFNIQLAVQVLIIFVGIGYFKVNGWDIDRS